MEKTLQELIGDWVTANKKIFWKYEVSSFYQTYKINVANLPKPGKEDIKVVSHRMLLSNEQKIQLCNIIKKVYNGPDKLKKSNIDLQIDYVKGMVKTAVI
ncbi:MAG: hypothetical protein V1874_05715 [Spirochaetota bacterium]